MEIKEALQGAIGNTFNTVGGFLPKLVSALVVLLIGYIVAKIIGGVLTKVLRTIKFNDIADKVGINGFMNKAGLKSDASGILGKMGYWMVMLTTLILFFNTLGLSAVSELLQQGVAFIPKLLVGCILLIVGMFGANFAKDLVVAALKGGGAAGKADLVGKITHGGIMFLIVTMVLDQIGIGGDIVNTLVTSLLGGLSIAAAIAFGLGGKDWAAKQISKLG